MLQPVWCVRCTGKLLARGNSEVFLPHFCAAEYRESGGLALGHLMQLPAVVKIGKVGPAIRIDTLARALIAHPLLLKVF